MNGNQLRFLRQRARLTQQQVADRWGLSRETVTRYETGALEVPAWVADAIKNVVREVPNGR